MELILKQDVENLGFKDDIVKVKNGYGRNYLIPKGYAVLATSSAKKILAENIKQQAFKEVKLVEDAREIAEKIKNYKIKIVSKVASGDKLFGSVNNSNLADSLAKLGTEINKKFIKVIGGNIKSLGKYNATIRLHRDVTVDMVFEVVAEKQ
ncbi:MAG: 50S ribosomal protein L9 [Tenacibaculum sp.]